MLHHFGSKENLLAGAADLDASPQELASLLAWWRRTTAAQRPAEHAPQVAAMIVAQASGLQPDLLATDDRERVDRSFALFVDLITQLGRNWSGDRPHSA